MVWWIVALQIIGYLASTYSIIKYLATPFNSPKASGLSDFTIPTADASRAIPVIFGTVKLTGANVVAYGDFGSFGFSAEGSKGKPVGYYYFLGMDLALCMGPVDAVHSCTFEDKSAGFTHTFESNDLGRFVANNVELWGGQKSGGGVQGEIDVYYGTAHQAADPYVKGWTSPDYPTMPGICHAVFRNLGGEYSPYETAVPGRFYFGGFYWGNQTYVKPVSFVIERCPNTLGLPWGLHYTSFDAPGWGHDANPACILYEILTDTTWGLGLSASMIDAGTFRAAGLTLAGEKFGMSMILEKQSAANELIADILRHIDGELYADPETGKLVLGLVRALSAEQIAALPVFDEANLSNVEFTRGSWSETYNTVKVNYISRFDNFTARVAQWQNLSNLQKRSGELAVLQVDFEGVATGGMASQIAARMLKGASYPFAKLRLFANRQAWKLRPGAAIKVNWPALGITGMVCRVVRPASGELVNGEISLDVIEDMFSFAGTGFSDPGPTEWVDPMTPPTPATIEALVEAPYQIVGGPGRHVMALAARSDAGVSGYKVFCDEAGGTNYVQTNSVGGMAPTGVLAGAWPANTASLDATGFSVTDLLDSAGLASTTSDGLYRGVNLALIDNEIISWRTISAAGETRQITNVLRGVLDTVPAYHASGARVWFLTDGPSGNWTNPTTPYSSDRTIAAKLLTFNPRAVLAIADAARMTVALGSRALKPLPPGKVRLSSVLVPGGSAWPDGVILTDPGNISCDVVVTWAHRHRVDQAAAGVVVSQDADNYSAAPEGTYTIQVRVDSVLKRTVTGITVTTWTWTTAMQSADGANLYSWGATISIIPVNGSLSGIAQVRGFLL
jgi:hypothetical protein